MNAIFIFALAVLTVRGVQAQSCANAIPLPANGQAAVGTAAPAAWFFDAQAGDQVALQARELPSSSGIRTPASDSSPTVALIGPGDIVLASQAAPATDLLRFARIPQTGVIMLPTGGRYCVVASTKGGTQAVAAITVFRTGQVCQADIGGYDSIFLSASTGQIWFDLLATPGCSLPITSDSPWVRSSKSHTTAGHQIVTLTLDSNHSTVQRFGRISIGSNTHVRVSQVSGSSANCSYSLTSPSLMVPAEGGRGVETLNTAPDCKYVVTSPVQWFWIEGFPEGWATAPAVPIRWNAAPNFRPSVRFATALVATQQMMVMQAANSAGENVRFVQLLYWGFFGRMPTPAEADFHARSGLSRAALAVNFFRSAEFANGGLFAAGLYLGVLDREPEFTGWLFQRQTLADRVLTREQLAANFLNSIEYREKVGVPAIEVFVRQMYIQILGRQPDSTEIRHHANAMNGGLTPAELVRNFLDSAEYRTRTLPALHPSLLYFTLLGRDASAEESASLRTAFAGGKTLQAAIADFVNSAEMLLLLR